MLIIYGKRNLRIKRYTDHAHQCSNCKSLDLRVSVSAQYFHVFFIPVAPTGLKSSKLWCHECGQVFRMDSLQSQYEKQTKTHFISRLPADDYFVKEEELVYTKKDLKEMLDDGEITTVIRND